MGEINGSKQDRPKELSIQFPRVPKELLDKLIPQYFKDWPDDDTVRKLETTMQEEPRLFQFISEYATICEDPVQFKIGAYFVYLVLESLREYGHNLPEVSTSTINTWLAENKALSGVLTNFPKELPIKGEEVIKLAKEIEQKLKSTEVYLYEPYDLADENPHLMVWIASRDDFQREGAMLAYELKRRQWHADQLAKQFGG